VQQPCPCSKHTAITDRDSARSLAVSAAAPLHLSYNTQALHYFSEHNMLAVQMRGGHGGNEELRMCQCCSNDLAMQPRGKPAVLTVLAWLPLVLGPEFAIDRRPGTVCLCLKFSSANFAP
jgi:hypothetical protein